MTSPLRYAGAALDRAEGPRRDQVWVDDRRQRPDTRIVPLWKGRHLIDGVTPDGTATAPAPVARMPAVAEAGPLLDAAVDLTLLGLDSDDTALFTADVSSLDEAAAVGLASGGAFIDLRHVGPWLAPDHANVLAYARGMLEWHRRHRFCGRCGSATTAAEAGHQRLCTSATCGKPSFPRTDPAVIMLVEHHPPDGASPSCLLAHHDRLPAGAYSTLAGFVEPGESLEEAVVREVREETGVAARDPRYVASQPWPFPGSLMIGFRARADRTAITLDEHELADAGWFTAADLRRFGEWHDDQATRRLPRRDSIARFLVESWLAEVDPVDADPDGQDRRTQAQP